MQVYLFDLGRAKEITKFESRGASIAGILRDTEATSIACVRLTKNGNLGFHPAVVNQLFLVVSGSGWVTGGDRVKILIGPGEAAFWQAGENHESGTEDGMTAIVVEGPNIDPRKWMAEKK